MSRPSDTNLKLVRESVDGKQCLSIVTELATISIAIERVPDLIAALREFVPVQGRG